MYVSGESLECTLGLWTFFFSHPHHFFVPVHVANTLRNCIPMWVGRTTHSLLVRLEVRISNPRTKWQQDMGRSLPARVSLAFRMVKRRQCWLANIVNKQHLCFLSFFTRREGRGGLYGSLKKKSNNNSSNSKNHRHDAN